MTNIRITVTSVYNTQYHRHELQTELPAPMLSVNFTFSKRLLGLLMLVGGAAAFAGILAIDLLDVGREGGIGPAQQIALAAAALCALVGVTLIPLGDRPA
jgi:hypothetical protein